MLFLFMFNRQGEARAVLQKKNCCLLIHEVIDNISQESLENIPCLQGWSLGPETLTKCPPMNKYPI